MRFSVKLCVIGIPILSSDALAICMTRMHTDEPSGPNIVIIFTDDQGYADLGVFGSRTNRTPNMDRLAKEGTMFMEFYAQAYSSPSRSALLTGRYPFKSQGKEMPASEVTFGEIAQNAGYQTVCIGKWDVSSRKPIMERMPNSQGFDYYYGTLGANDSGIVDIYENNIFVRKEKDMSILIREYTDKAIDFLNNKRAPGRPFLIYLAHTMMHSVIDASEEFKGKSRGGLYGDVVEEFDYHTGRLVEALEKLDLRKNTLIIYTTDNGPWCQPRYYENSKNRAKYPIGTKFWGDPGIFRGGKGSLYEAGSRVPCIMSWPGRIPQGEKRDGLIATIDLLPTFAAFWGIELPDTLNIDGVDQSDFITSDKNTARASFGYMQARKNDIMAVRDKRWKLILPDRKFKEAAPHLMDFGTNDYELYDLKNDPSEKVNLIDKYPKVVERLKNEIDHIVHK